VRAIGYGSFATGFADAGYYPSPAPPVNVGVAARGKGDLAFGCAVQGWPPMNSYIHTRDGGPWSRGGNLAFGRTYGGDIYARGWGGSVAGGYAEEGGLVQASAQASMAFGNAGPYGLLEAAGYGAMASGWVGGVSPGPAGSIEADGTGSRAFGVTIGSGSFIRAAQNGSFACGVVQSGGSIEANGHGSHAQGRAYGGIIDAGGPGATAFGWANAGGAIYSLGYGCFARGVVNTYVGANDGRIVASNRGTVASGVANGGPNYDGGIYAGTAITGRASFVHGRTYQGEIRSDSEASMVGGATFRRDANQSRIRATNPGYGNMVWGHVDYGGEIYAQGASGAHVFGSAKYGGIIKATGDGAQAGGLTYGAGSTIEATQDGSTAFGYTKNSGVIRTAFAGQGGLACGRADDSGLIYSRSRGALARGYARDYGTIEAGDPAGAAAGRGAFASGTAEGVDSIIKAVKPGSHALGFADSGGVILSGYAGSLAAGYAADGLIYASAQGAFALGHAASGYDITASGLGAFALGFANAGSIRALANNAFQLGEGINNLADTTQIGNAGLRLKGTAGVPAALQNGDIWVYGGYVYIRSNGVTCKCVNANM
jgi:hypothetical protein